MKQVILIDVDDTSGLEPDNNFIVQDTTTGIRYFGEGGTTLTAIYDQNNEPTGRKGIRQVTGTDTLLDTDFIVECDGTFTFTLFSADGMVNGLVYYIKNIGSGTITVDADGTETIDGAANIALAQWDSISICVNSSGTGWNILGRS